MRLTRDLGWVSYAALSLALGGLAAGQAFAQEQTSEAVLEEIVVTAQKRSENLQDVPVAVSALSAQALESAYVRSLQDLSAAVPGFVTTNTANYGAAPLSIRGVGGTNGGANGFADEPVSVYLDDVYIGRLRFSTSQILDVDSIQVLRGPQGTLYGRNATAGALLIRSARPTREMSGYLKASAASFGAYRASAALSSAISDKVAMRAALGYAKEDGWGRNTVNGQHLPHSRDLAARVITTIDVTDNLTTNLILERLDNSLTVGLLPLSDLSELANPAPPNTVTPFAKRADFDRDLKSRNFAADVPTRTDVTSNAATFTAHWKLDGMALDWISGYRDWTTDGTQDSDASALDLVRNGGRLKDSSFSQEVRLSSDSDGALKWVVGLFAMTEKNAMGPFGITANIFVAGAGISTAYDSRQTTDAYALFGDATYTLSPQWSVTLGGRYGYEKKNFNAKILRTTVRPLPTIPAGTVILNASADHEADWKDFSPRGVLTFRPNDDVMAYFSVSRAFKSGGFNAFDTQDAFDPEKIVSYETGLKLEDPSRRWRLNSSAFLYDYTDLQVRVPLVTGGVAIANAGGARLKGVEVEGMILPVRGLRVSGNIAWLDARYRGHTLLTTVAPVSQFGAGTVSPTEDIDGHHLTRAPRWSAAANVSYTWDLSSGVVMTAEANYRFQSRSYFLETHQEAETFQTPGWSESGVRLSASTADGRYEAALFGANVFDKRRATQIFSLGGLPVAAVNTPRTWGVALTAKF